MEEQKNTEQQKMSYDDLRNLAGELHQQNQRLAQENRQMRQALESRDFDYSSFFLSMLFKVLEHPNRYSDKFVKWCTTRIEDALVSFDAAAQEAVKKEQEAKSQEKKAEEAKDEAE